MCAESSCVRARENISRGARARSRRLITISSAPQFISESSWIIGKGFGSCIYIYRYIYRAVARKVFTAAHDVLSLSLHSLVAENWNIARYDRYLFVCSLRPWRGNCYGLTAAGIALEILASVRRALRCFFPTDRENCIYNIFCTRQLANSIRWRLVMELWR